MQLLSHLKETTPDGNKGLQILGAYAWLSAIKNYGSY